MAFFENYWDCPNCGQKHISALRKRHCPACNHNKTDIDHEYMGGEITDPEGLKLAQADAYWVCRFCGGVNLDDALSCSDCGHGRDESDQEPHDLDYGENPPRSAEDLSGIHIPQGEPAPDIDTLPAGFLPYTEKPKRKNDELPPKRKNDDNDFTPSWYKERRSSAYSNTDWVRVVGVILSVIAVVGACGFLLYMIFHTTPVDGKVTAFSWSREYVIERYQTQHESGWSMPIGARMTSSDRRVMRYEPIYENKTSTVSKTCYRNRGNGSSESYDCSTTKTERIKVGETPIYGTWYEYDIDKFVYNRTERAGNNDRKPHWPAYKLNLEGQVVIGAERISASNQKYTVHFSRTVEKDQKVFREVYDYDTSESEWMQYNMDEFYTLAVNGFGGIMNNPLQDKMKEQETKK